MIKKKLYGDTLKEQLVASAKDRLINFSLARGSVRGVMANGTRMINEMRTNHELGILETLVLGRAYLGVGLMGANLKGEDRIGLQIDCTGPIKGLSVEANAFGEVRGFLKQVPIPIEKPLESFDLSAFFGAGFLSLTRYLKDAKYPFTGKVALMYGNVAKDLAYYSITSDQIPTAVNLSIQFDRQGEVIGAGGLLLQTLPGAAPQRISDLEELVLHFPSLGRLFSEGKKPRKVIHETFQAHDPKILDDRRIEFMCHCNKERIRNLIMMLPLEDLKDIRDNGPFPLETRCHNCNTTYSFEREEIRQLYGLRFPDN
jgi:molecular chaperone Hsp33